MGSVKLDPMFRDLNRRIGNYVHYKWKGKRVIRTVNDDPRPPATDAQLAVQKAFKITAETWRKLPEFLKQSWKPYTQGKAVTELNLFIRENANRQRLGIPFILTKGNGIEMLNGLTAAAAIPGGIAIDFDIPAIPVNLHVILQNMTDGLANSEIIIKPDIYTGTKPVQFTGLTAGAEYFINCFTTDGVFTDAVLVSESAGFKVKIV